MKILPKIKHGVHKFTSFLRLLKRRLRVVKSKFATQIRIRRKQLFPFALGAIIILLPVFYLLLKNPHQVAAAWYSDAWPYRKSIAVTNPSGGTLTNYQVSFTLNTSSTNNNGLIRLRKMKADCSDLRVTDSGSTLLSYWIEESGSGACNSTTTKVWVKIPSLTTSGTTIYLYYGNPLVTSSSSGANTFDFYDTFTGSSIDNAKWHASSTGTISGGSATLSSGNTLSSLNTLTDASGLGKLIFRAKQAATSLTGGKIGFSNTLNPLNHPNTDQAALLILGSTEEQIANTAATSLISHHQLEETTTTDANQFKASGYLDTGKLGQAVSMYGNAAGTQGSTLTFNRGAQISGNNYEHVNTNQGSVSLWVKPSWAQTDNLNHYLFSYTNFYIYKNASNFICAKVPGASEICSATTSSLTQNQFAFISLEWDADNQINGGSNTVELRVNNSIATNRSSAYTPSIGTATTVYIGSNDTGANQAQALIDDFAIWDRVLTTTEITDLYNTGTGKEAGTYADPSLKFYAKMDGTGTLAPVTYNLGANSDQKPYNSSTNTNGNMVVDGNMEAADTSAYVGRNSSVLTKETTGMLFDTKMIKVTAPGVAQWTAFDQSFSATANTNYHISFWYTSNRASSGSTNFAFGPWANTDYANAGNAEKYIDLVGDSTWKYAEIEWKAQNTQTYYLMFRHWMSSSNYLYVDNLTLTPSLVDNGGMEGTYSAGVAPGWTSLGSGTPAQETTTIHSGTSSQKLTYVANNDRIVNSSAITTVSGNWYLATAWINTNKGGAQQTRFIGSTSQNNSLYFDKSVTTTGSWVKTSAVFQATATTLFVGLWLSTSGAVAYVDDVSVVPLDNIAGSLKAWTPVMDSPGANSTELLSNTGFETAGAGIPSDLWGSWSENIGDGSSEDITTIVNNGNHAAKLTSGVLLGTMPQISQTVTVVPGKNYVYSFYTRGDGTNAGRYVIYDLTNSAYIVTAESTGNTGNSYVKYSTTFTAPAGCTRVNVYLRHPGVTGGFAYFDDVSVRESNNPLSVQGGVSGVASNATGARGNAYTFDGSTGYLRQKTYAVNIGDLSYLGNDTTTAELSDTGQTFTGYATGSGTAYAYMIVVTNSDNTTSWGYLGASDTANHINIHTAKGSATRGWNGTAPVAGTKTAVGYEIRKTDFQVTSAFTTGGWVKIGSKVGDTVIFSKYYTTSYKTIFGLSGGGSNILATVANSSNAYGVTTSNLLDTGNWHFWTMAYDGSQADNASRLKVYYDGTLQTLTFTGTIPVTAPDIPGAFQLGHQDTSSVYLNGSIDSPFVIASALTADQIKDIYNSTASHYGLVTNLAGVNTQPANTGTPVTDSNTYHTYTLTSLAASSTLVQDGTTIAASTTTLPTAAEYLRLQNTDTTNNLVVDWVAVAKNATTPPVPTVATAEEKGGGPVLYYRFDETSGVTAHDASTYQNNGTVTAGTWLSSDLCVVDRCVQLNGTTSVVTPTSNTTNVQTLSLWVKPATASQSILDLDGGSHKLSTTNGVLIATGFDTVYINGKTGTAIATNRWTFIEVASSTPFNTVSSTIGKIGGNYFTGFMDDVKIYPYARTAAQVKTDYAARGSSKGVTAIDPATLLGSVKINMTTGAVTGKARVLNSGGYLDFSNYLSNVTVNLSTGVFSGYAFSEDMGWLAFGTADNASGPVQLNLTTGVISGKAKVLDTGAYLDFGSYKSAVSVNLSTGNTYGYAFSEDVGWLAFGVSIPDNPAGIVNANLTTGAITGKALGLNTNEYLDFTAYNSTVAISMISGVFSGYGFSKDVGWVAFGTTDNTLGPVRINLTTGAITGKAKVLDTGAYLDFTNYGSNVKVNLKTGAVTGHVWSEDVGWLYLGGTTSSLNGTAIIFFRFDEGYGSTANNSGASGSTYNGTLNNTTWTNDGKEGKGVTINGSAGSNVSAGDVKY